MTRTFVDGIETEQCKECKGHGVYYCDECKQETTACETCHGSGEVPKKQRAGNRKGGSEE